MPLGGPHPSAWEGETRQKNLDLATWLLPLAFLS